MRPFHGGSSSNHSELKIGLRTNTLAVLLLVLLVGSIGFSVYEYQENTRLASENQQLKADNQTLHDQVTKQADQLAEAQAEIQALKANITALRRQLQIKDSITVGLTFLWNPSLGTPSVAYLQTIVDYMNDNIWANFHVYFFIRDAEPRDFVPASEICISGLTLATWGRQALALFDGNDIPVLLVSYIAGEDVNEVIAGCALTSGYPLIFLSLSALEGISLIVEEWAVILSHEILHLFGFSDKELYLPCGIRACVIPAEWTNRIQEGARRFRMPTQHTQP